MGCLIWLMSTFLLSLLFMTLIHLRGARPYEIIYNVMLLHFSLDCDLF